MKGSMDLGLDFNNPVEKWMGVVMIVGGLLAFGLMLLNAHLSPIED